MTREKYLKLSLKKKMQEEKAIQKESKRKRKWLIKVASKHIINSAVNDETYSTFKVDLSDGECDKVQDTLNNKFNFMLISVSCCEGFTTVIWHLKENNNVTNN